MMVRATVKFKWIVKSSVMFSLIFAFSIQHTDAVALQSCKHLFKNSQICPHPAPNPDSPENELKTLTDSSISSSRFHTLSESTPCKLDGSVSLQDFAISSSPWEFIHSDECTSFYQFPGVSREEDAELVCTRSQEMQPSGRKSWLSNPSLRIRWNKDNDTSFAIAYENVPPRFSSELNSFCDMEPKYLYVLFQLITDNQCQVQLQQFTINNSLQALDSNCRSSTNGKVCSLYNCSSSSDLIEKLRHFSSPSDRIPAPLQLEKVLEPVQSRLTKQEMIREFEAEEDRQLKKRAQWTTQEYAIWITIIVGFIVITGLVFLKLCLHFAPQSAQWPRSSQQRHTPSSSRRASQASLNPYLTKPPLLPAYGPILKCSKPACCIGDHFQQPGKGGRRWSHQIDSPYSPATHSPLRTDNIAQPLISARQ